MIQESLQRNRLHNRDLRILSTAPDEAPRKASELATRDMGSLGCSKSIPDAESSTAVPGTDSLAGNEDCRAVSSDTIIFRAFDSAEKAEDFLQERMESSPRGEERKDGAMPTPPPISKDSSAQHTTIQRRHRSQSVPIECEATPATKVSPAPAGVLKRSMSASGELPKTTSSTTKKRSTVSFDRIEVREYSLTLGDHVPTSGGPPISLGWDYETTETTTVDKYEFAREPAHRRSGRQLYLNIWTRRKLLSSCGREFDDAEMQKAEMAAKDVRKSRKMARRLYYVESAGRKLKWFTLQYLEHAGDYYAESD